MELTDNNLVHYLEVQEHNLNKDNAIRTLDQVTANLYNNGYENLVDHAIDDGTNLTYTNDVLENTTDYTPDEVKSAEQAQGDYLTEDCTDVNKMDVLHVLDSLIDLA